MLLNLILPGMMSNSISSVNSADNSVSDAVTAGYNVSPPNHGSAVYSAESDSAVRYANDGRDGYVDLTLI